MSRKVILIVAAALLAGAPLVGGLATVAYVGPLRAALWAQQQMVRMSVRGGPEVVLEVDADTVRRNSLDLLRRMIVLNLRDAKLKFNTRVTDAGIEVSAQEEDRQAVMSVLRGKLAPTVDIKLAGDGVVRVGLTDALLAQWTADAVEKSRLQLSARFFDLGTKAVVIDQPHAAGARLLVRMAKTEDPQRLIAFATKPGVLTFRMIDESMSPKQALASAPPPNTDILYDLPESGKHPYVVERRAIITGSDLTDAQPGYDERTNEPIVSFRFNAAGTRKFAQATGENVNRAMAVVVDDEVLSAPIIREPITGGSGQISGAFTAQSANELAAVLRYGALPARLKVVEERTAKAR